MTVSPADAYGHMMAQRKASSTGSMEVGDGVKYTGSISRGVPPTVHQSQSPEAVYQNIQESSAKRISSLDYLKKTYGFDIETSRLPQLGHH